MKLAPLVRALSRRQMDIAPEWAEEEYLPIVPSSRLWLAARGDGNRPRFAGLFAATWRQIPLWGRRACVKHWREDPFPFQQGLWSPLIELAADWELSDRCWRQPKDMGVCGRNAHSLYFYQPLVDALPPQHVSELIAHELAHVVQYAKGWIERNSVDAPNDRSTPRLFDDNEIAADEIMEEWGFNPDGLEEWVDQNWKWLE